ncbi:MAG TPA: monovalent cation/H+ antiporter complex subunit F, partial [Candidatus Krumholzibacterium sp.]|nr:monovalent cation/H+ antiporter complex subunit F [Candidatus Krumholzibacterium sp.]
MILAASGVLTMGAIILAGIRFFRGPTAADRTAAFDTLTIISISIIAMLATFYGKGIFLDVAMIYGILSFIGVIAIARYLEGG